ncbi:MAG: hypothetical protein WB565_10360 [Acidimicrobiales bacterium]
MTREAKTYIAAPVAVLLRPEWPIIVDSVSKLVGQVWDPAALFLSTEDWLAKWPALVPFVRDLVIVPDCDGSIGAGCLREIAEVLGRDRQVQAYLAGELIPWWDLTLRPAPVPTRFSVATVSHETET